MCLFIESWCNLPDLIFLEGILERNIVVAEDFTGVYLYSQGVLQPDP